MNLDIQVPKLCSPLIVDDKLPQALPSKSMGPSITNLPEITHPAIAQIIEEYKLLFSPQIGRINIMHHNIDTGDASPVKVPPCHIPFHYVDRVQKQLTDMVHEGIIRPSSSPWCVPAVYRICPT